MQMILQPNGWTCLPTAFAMVCRTVPKAIFDWFGFDGSEIIVPELPDPLGRRSFHIQEMIDFCVAHNVYPVEIARESGIVWEEKVLEVKCLPITHYLVKRDGVLVGTIDGKNHAVAWCHEEQRIFDPKGLKYGYNLFDADAFYCCF